MANDNTRVPSTQSARETKALGDFLIVKKQPTPLDDVLGLPNGGAQIFLDVFASGMTGSQAIERQEHQAQADSCNVQNLPKQALGQKEVWESLGFELGEEVDDLFITAKFPSGWKFKPTDHYMYSDLIDDRGNVRGRMGYKGAFYDRWASITLLQRYGCRRDYGAPDDIARVIITDRGVVIQTLEKVIGDRKSSDIESELYEEAKALLNSTYSQWEDPTAYWDLV